MLEKVFSKTNIFINAFMTAAIVVVWITFLGNPAVLSIIVGFFFFGLLFVFDWIVELNKDRV